MIYNLFHYRSLLSFFCASGDFSQSNWNTYFSTSELKPCNKYIAFDRTNTFSILMQLFKILYFLKDSGSYTKDGLICLVNIS